MGIGGGKEGGGGKVRGAVGRRERNGRRAKG